jgi:hypothetical protein
MLISLAQCSQRPIDIIEELDAISIDCAKNGLFFVSGKKDKETEKRRDCAPFEIAAYGTFRGGFPAGRHRAAGVEFASRTVNTVQFLERGPYFLLYILPGMGDCTLFSPFPHARPQ